MSRRLLHVKTVPKLYCNNVESFRYSKEVPTHEVLTKLNYISHPKAGLVNWLQAGLSMNRKVGNIVRKRMEEIGFEELSLSALSHTSSWKKTGRSENQELFKIKDEDFILAPTAEEEITNHAKQSISSYKNLPLLLYQVTPKYRNEKRPRSGLLRGKEFIMKDAYSFDIDEKNAMATYDKVIGAYTSIFNDLKVPFAKAAADSGDIGGSLSHEWHYLHESGEDVVFKCDSCDSISNMEKALSYPQEGPTDGGAVSVRYFMTSDKSTLVCAYYPSDREIQANFVKNEVPDLDLTVTDQEAILKEFSDEDTLISKKILRIMDSRLNSRSNFPDFPISFINRSLITTLSDIPIVSAQENELCYECEEGTLHGHKAIEIGHTFYLGDKYSKPLDCTVEVPVSSSGKTEKKNIMMGCYGIGVSRIIAAIGEINRDDIGLRWPKDIAPWTVTVVEGSKGAEYEDLYNALENSGIDYRLDDRDQVRLGRKIKQSNMMGIPLTVILGKNYPMVEIEIRGKRYHHELKWKKLYENKDFEWEVKYDGDRDVKHYVHKDGVAAVIKSLLADM